MLTGHKSRNKFNKEFIEKHYFNTRLKVAPEEKDLSFLNILLVDIRC